MKDYSPYFTTSLFILGIFGTATLYLLLQVPRPYFVDSAVYAELARAIQQDQWHVHYRNGQMMSFAPFYSMLISLLERVVHNFESAGMIVSIIAGSLATIPAILLAKRFYGLGVAFLALIFFMFNPFYVLYSSAILTEALFTFLFLTAIYVVYLAISEKSLIMWFSAGVIGGAAWLTRDVGIIIPVAALFWLIICLLKKQYFFKKFVVFGAALTIGLLIAYLPIKTLIYFDKQNTPNLYPPLSITHQLITPDLRDITQRELYYRELADNGKEYKHIVWLKTDIKLAGLIKNWQWVFKKIFINIIEIGKTFFSTSLLFFSFFIIIGVFASKDKASPWLRQNRLFILSFIFLYILFYASAGAYTGARSSERYFVPLIPILMIWCTIGIQWIRKKISQTITKGGDFIIIILVASLVAANILSTYLIVTKYIAWNADKTSLAGLAMISAFENKNQKQNKMIIMSRDTLLAYYANMLPLLTPYGEYDEIIKFAKLKKVDFFFLEKSLYAPQLEFLKNTKDSTPDLKFILSIDQGNLYKVTY